MMKFKTVLSNTFFNINDKLLSKLKLSLEINSQKHITLVH